MSLPSPPPESVDWAVSPGLVPYEAALTLMEARARAIRDEGARELIWLLEHPPLYTAGTSGKDVRKFVQNLENWVISALASFNIDAQTRAGRVGVWVDRTRPGGALREDKIAAIGVRLKRWVSFHGLSLNVEPDLTHFGGITPCGISADGLGVTSLVDLGYPVGMDEADAALKTAFQNVFASHAKPAQPPKF